MRRNYLVITAVSCVFFQLAGCQQQAITEAVAKQGEPKIEFESLVYDFGKVGPGKKLLGEFKFTNIGGAPLNITKVEKCCGAVIKLDKDELAPGESGVLNVQYTSSRMPGKMSKKLYVNSNDKDMPRAILTIQAETVLKVAHEPEKLSLTLKEDNAGCPEITLTSVDGQPFSIKAFRATGNSITAEVDPSVEATRFVLQPKVDVEKLKEHSSGYINITLSHPECDRLYISFRALLRFRVTPTAIMVLNAEPQKPVAKKISVISNYNEDFEVDSVSSESGFVKLLSQEKIDKGYRFEVEVTTPPNDGTGKFADVCYINLKDGDRLLIRFYGQYLKPAASGE